MKKIQPVGNYLTYIKRSVEIMNAPEIANQINGAKAKKVFNQALEKYMKEE